MVLNEEAYETPIAEIEIIETEDVITISGIDESVDIDMAGFAIIEVDLD